MKKYFLRSTLFIPGLFAFSLLLFLMGCCSYKCPAPDAASHPLYRTIPRHRCQIRPYDLGHWTTWMLFGNDDDGLFGESDHSHYQPDKPPSFQKALRWWCRNPFHNFCFYVIGSAHTVNSQFTLLQLTGKGSRFLEYRRSGGYNFPSEKSSLYLGFHGWKPFISLRLAYGSHRRTDFYFGWRERGNFGAAFKPFAKKD